MLDALDPEQRRAASQLLGPVVILAGAGTGKTRAITYRIAHGVQQGVYAGHDVLAVTFTQRAAGEMRSRLARLGAPGVQARTFHSAALRQLRYFWPKVYGGDLPDITASKIPLVTLAARQAGIVNDPALLRDIAAEIEWAKVSNVTADAYPSLASRYARSVAGLSPELVAALMVGYETAKRESSRMDMEDILLMTAALLGSEPEIAAQIRSQYRHFVVDEYQDVSPLQHSLLKLWLGDRSDVCVVGDPNQTIYSFAGATADYLTDFQKEFPSATKIELVRNYRSTPQIVATANAVFKSNRGVVLKSQKPDGAEVEYFTAADESAEVNQVVNRIRALQSSGVALREMAILFRINAQSEAFEDALDEADIPYVVRGVERFYERAEVRQAIALIKALARTNPDLRENLSAEIAAALSAMGYSQKPPAGRGAVRDRWESLHALVGMVDEFSPEKTISDLVAELETRSEHAHAPSAEGVTLATLHSAKGLEWDCVFLVSMHEGSMPSSLSTTPAQIEEERRLFYVGITRARAFLHLSFAATRAGRSPRKPSRFLDIPENLRPVKTPSAQIRHRTVAKCRICNKVLSTPPARKLGRCEGCPSSYDEEFFEQLKSWRTNEAQELKMPAYVVFTDATLMAIAEALPQTAEQLSAIAGIGPAKLEKYGELLLEMCAQSAKPGK